MTDSLRLPSAITTRCTMLLPTPTVRPIFRTHAVGLELAYAGAPAQPRTLRLGPRKPGIHPFPDDAALELSKHAEHLERRLARAGRCVEPLLVQEQIDALLL